MVRQKIRNEEEWGLVHIEERIRFDETAPVRETIAQEGALRVVLFCLAAGQEISRHTAAATVLMQVVTGEGVLVSGDERHDASTGDLLAVPPLVPHAMKAGSGPFAVLATIVSTAG